MTDPPAPNLAVERAARLRAEAALHELEDLHRLLVEGVRDYAIILIDPAGRIATWNEGAKRLVGYDEGEIIGRPAAVLFTPEERRDGLPERELHGAAATGRFEDENWIARKDGTRFWASGVCNAQRDDAGGLRGFVKIFRDLTERREAADALRESEERLRVALAAARMGTWLWHIETNRQMLDESLRDLLGLPAGQPVMRLEDFLALLHPDDRAATGEAFTRAVRDGTELSVEFRVARPDGAVRWLRDQGDVVRDEAGRAEFLAGACVDITDRKALEGDLRRTRDELERRVEERTADLRRAQARAVQAERLAAIGETMAGLAHESGNALQRAQTYLERLRWRLNDHPEALALLAELQKSQDDLLRLYDDVRGYAAPLTLDVHLTDLASVWRSAWERAAGARGARQVQLREAAGWGDLTIAADPFRLEQVFRNLFENALEATAGSVVVTVACADTTLAGRPAVRVSVRDDGPGLTAEQRASLFDPFYTTKTKGTGLGLAIARRIVEAHGGEIAAGDGPGPGAEIVITLPRERA
ncbi:MAG TPA: PAS domain S-box protein [Gemmataceae bacterium]|jgi:two-component system CheB/CheR fusion protein